MIELENKLIRLAVDDDGSRLTVYDLQRNSAWSVDDDTAVYYLASGDDNKRPLVNGRARRDGSTIVVSFDVPDGTVCFTYALLTDGLEITLDVDCQQITAVALPGALYNTAGAQTVLLPHHQGVRLRPVGSAFEATRKLQGHWCTMNMAGLSADRAGLLMIQETNHDFNFRFGESTDRNTYVLFDQTRCRVHGWQRRRVRLYATDPDITSICKRYRRRLIECGQFVGWAEKIERKPIVKNLFGSLIAFTGYQASDQIDYVVSARQVKSQGFDSILFYPGRMCHPTSGIKLGGDEPIWLSDEQVRHTKQIDGAMLAPWAWIDERLDDGLPQTRQNLATKEDGNLQPHWSMDGLQWYFICLPYQIEYIKQLYSHDIKDMDWIHYDVSACYPGVTCFNADHELHDGSPIGEREGIEYTKQLLGAEVNGNRIVSSEGFASHHTMAYDIGTVKLLPTWGNYRYIPIPMTMLVFHDSCVHDWHETQHYNEQIVAWQPEAEHEGMRSGCGSPEKKAAMDALYGCPPNVFPFGRQYYFAEVGETASLEVRVDDKPVQRALRAALPVARLHKRIGQCELLSFRSLTDDHTVQATEFSDGTRVIANISDDDRQVDEVGHVAANTWRTSD